MKNAGIAGIFHWARNVACARFSVVPGTPLAAETAAALPVTTAIATVATAAATPITTVAAAAFSTATAAVAATTATATTVATTSATVAASATASAVAAISAATAPATTEAAATLLLTGLVDHEAAAFEGITVQRPDGVLGGFRIGHGDETETARTTGFTVHDDAGISHFTVGAEQLRELSIGRPPGQVADVNLGWHRKSSSKRKVTLHFEASRNGKPRNATEREPATCV
jgi:hypothetical protein